MGIGQYNQVIRGLFLPNPGGLLEWPALGGVWLRGLWTPQLSSGPNAAKFILFSVGLLAACILCSVRGNGNWDVQWTKPMTSEDKPRPVAGLPFPARLAQRPACPVLCDCPGPPYAVTLSSGPATAPPGAP